MIRAAIVSAVVLGLAAPVGAAGVKKDRVDLLVSLICKNGGSMETSKAAEILPKHGFTMQETQSFVAELEKRGQVQATAGMATLKLKKSACS